MKKLFLIAAVAMGMGAFTSCNNAGSCKADKDPQLDTLTAYFGEMYGSGIARQMQMDGDSTFNKKEFLAGLQSVLNLDDKKQSYVNGLQFGMQIKATLEQIKEREHVEIDSKEWLASFKKAFMSDSAADPMTYQAKVMSLMKELSDKVKQNDPKAIANKKLEEKFIADSLEGKVMKSEGGVYYKVIAEGNGEKFAKTDRVMVKYTGRHLNGEEFDSSKGEAIPMSPMRVVQGMGEMLQLMSPGAKYVLYIPGELAYGVEGSGPIEPNEMLIFDVETVGVETAKK